MKRAIRNLFKQYPAGIRFCIIVMLVLFLAPFEIASAQNTFTVTVAQKSEDHPYYQQGWGEAYVISGVQGRELTLTRGETYSFQMQNVPAIHPFYITTSPAGGPGAAAYSEGVTNNDATGNAILTFTPDENTPDTLYYQCHAHEYMGYRIIISDTATDTDDDRTLPDSFRLLGNYPNPFNPTTHIRFDLRSPAVTSVEVFDLAGRKVLTIPAQVFPAGTGHSIEIDAASLTSGVYFYRVTAEMTAEKQIETGVMTLIR